ncbi:hypothetical protein [Halococcus saccharolyticus]|uniref:hypothetical protein n=1 Tax=Halococcus saccharolyticus TaxID=62319 RepID=UPI0012671A1C|nr:hypothetical protein [Halococcus saccharolyticus]
MEIDEADVMVSDIAGNGLPVYVNKENSRYSGSLQTKVDELHPGNVIEAEIQSESVTRQDDIWKFLEINVVGRTKFYFIENADIHSSHTSNLAELAKDSEEGGARTTLSSGGDVAGFITVSVDKGDMFWNNLRAGVNTHEFDMRNLEEIDNPPYDILYTRNSDEDILAFYHLAIQNTGFVDRFLSLNDNIVSNV